MGEQRQISRQYKNLGYLGETRSRAWVKSIVWRLAGIFILGGISYAFTRDWAETTWITITFHIFRTGLYYWHERLWDKVDWGRRYV